jgi:hypothetical protein
VPALEIVVEFEFERGGFEGGGGSKEEGVRRRRQFEGGGSSKEEAVRRRRELSEEEEEEEGVGRSEGSQMLALKVNRYRRRRDISKLKEGIEEGSQMQALGVDVDVGKVCRKDGGLEVKME